MIKSIVIKTQFEGIHCWPEAPDHTKYLRTNHRHIFNVKLEMGVYDNDRQIEFFDALHKLNSYIKETFPRKDDVHTLGRMSCEDIAENILEWSFKEFGNRYAYVMVDEDGENGAVIKTDANYDDKKQNIKVEEESNETSIFNEYQRMSYTAIQEHTSNIDELLHWMIGLNEECGEFSREVKHFLYGGEQLSAENLLEEIGDVLWHLSAICTVLNIDLSDAMLYNLYKLENRYNGQWDEERSINRKKIDQDWGSLEKARKQMIEKTRKNMEKKGWEPK